MLTRTLLRIFKESSVSQACLAVVFLTSLATLNILQAFTIGVIKPLSLHWFQKLTYYFAYFAHIQTVFAMQWWCGSRIILFSDPAHSHYFGNEPALLLPNHKYEVDFLFCFFLSDCFHIIGNVKWVLKKSSLYVPFIGWGTKMIDAIALERNWEKDEKSLGKQLAKLMSYRDPYWILFFPEGTRFTNAKHEESMKIARSKGMPELKHHLLPRTRGFVASVNHLREKMPAVYDVLIAINPDQAHAPTVFSMLNGRSITVNILLRRIPMNEIPEDETKAAEWLHELYRHKDKCLDNFLKTGEFNPASCNMPEYKRFVREELPGRYGSLITEILLFCLIGVPLFYWIICRFLIGDWTFIAITLSLIISVHAGLSKMVELTKITQKRVEEQTKT